MSAPAFAWAIEQGRILKLPTSDRIILMYLADKANGIRLAWPSQATIADNTGLTDRAVRISTGRLEAQGLIRIEMRGKSRLYHILRPVNGEAHTPEVSSSIPPVDNSKTPEVSSVVRRTTPEVSSPTPEVSSKIPEVTSAKPSYNQEENLKSSQEGEGFKSGEEEDGAPSGSAPHPSDGFTVPEAERVDPAKLEDLIRRMARGCQNNYPPRAPVLDRWQQADVIRAGCQDKPRRLDGHALAAARRAAGIRSPAMQEP